MSKLVCSECLEFFCLLQKKIKIVAHILYRSDEQKTYFEEEKKQKYENEYFWDTL